PGRLHRDVSERAQQLTSGGEPLVLAPALGARVEVAAQPCLVVDVQRLEQPSRAQLSRALMRRLGVVVPAAEGQGHRPPLASRANVASRSASVARSISFSAASACRSDSRARVRIARAATWLTPIASASSRPVRSWISA